MKIKELFKLFLSIIFVSCGGNAQPTERDELYIESDQTQNSNVNDEKDNYINPPVIIDNLTPAGDNTNEQIIEVSNKPIKSKRFYCGLIDDFCKKFFDRKFAGTHYIPGSIHVDIITEFDSNTVVVKGTHSFKSPIILRNNKEFKAIIRDDGNNQYHIDFQRYGVRFGGLKSTGLLPYYYNPEE